VILTSFCEKVDLHLKLKIFT